MSRDQWSRPRLGEVENLGVGMVGSNILPPFSDSGAPCISASASISTQLPAFCLRSLRLSF